VGTVCKCDRVNLFLKRGLVFVVKRVAQPPERSGGLAF